MIAFPTAGASVRQNLHPLFFPTQTTNQAEDKVRQANEIRLNLILDSFASAIKQRKIYDNDGNLMDRKFRDGLAQAFARGVKISAYYDPKEHINPKDDIVEIEMNYRVGGGMAFSWDGKSKKFSPGVKSIENGAEKWGPDSSKELAEYRSAITRKENAKNDLEHLRTAEDRARANAKLTKAEDTITRLSSKFLTTERTVGPAKK